MSLPSSSESARERPGISLRALARRGVRELRRDTRAFRRRSCPNNQVGSDRFSASRRFYILIALNFRQKIRISCLIILKLPSTFLLPWLFCDSRAPGWFACGPVLIRLESVL